MKDYKSLSVKLHSPKYFQDLCFSLKITYLADVYQHAVDFLLPFGDASNASTPDSALNELESMVPDETVDELWHGQWNDAYLQFEDYFEFTSRSIRFSSSMNISSSISGSSGLMTARLSTKWVNLTDSLKKQNDNNPIYLYRLSNGQLSGHHLKVYPVVCSDRGFCFAVDLGDQKTDLASADVHFSLPSQLFEEGSTTKEKLFRLEFVFEFSFQSEDSHAPSTSIFVDLSLLDAAHPCYYFNPERKLITDRPGHCENNGICVASREVPHQNWKCLCPTNYGGPRCEVTDYCSQRLYTLPGGNGSLLTGTEVCQARGPSAGACVNKAFGFSCDCGGDSDYSWRPATMECRLVPLCSKAPYRDVCDPITQVCVEPPEDGSKGKNVSCRCVPGYVETKISENKVSCSKPNACLPSPCGANAECLPVFNSMDDFKNPKNGIGPAICYCRKGYIQDKKLSDDSGKLTCSKLDPCKVGGELSPPCPQICNSTKDGNGHQCSCFPGYQQDPQHSSRCVIPGSTCKCNAIGSWCDKDNKCTCKDGFNYKPDFKLATKDPKTNKTTVEACVVNSTVVHDAQCPNKKLTNNEKTGALECSCHGIYELDPKRRICQLKPICSGVDAYGEKDCSSKGALCLLTDKANQVRQFHFFVNYFSKLFFLFRFKHPPKAQQQLQKLLSQLPKQWKQT